MAYMAFIALVLLSSSTVVAPLCFGWFDDGEEDETAATPMNGTAAPTVPATASSSCQALDDVLSYFNDLYDYLDQTFNPFYEPSPAPALPAPALNTTLNNTSTTPAPP